MQRRTLCLITLLCAIAFLLAAAAPADAKQLVRLTGYGPLMFKALDLPRDMEIAGVGLNHRDYLVTEDQLSALRLRGVSFEVLDPDVEGTLRANRAGYPTLAEVENQLQTVASNYPGITNLFSLGKSYQNRDQWALEISDNPGVDEGETELIFVGLHHAREWPSTVVTLFYIDQLTQNYGSDPTITDWVNTRRIWIIPVLNPDGYYYCRDQGNDWRKNRHYLPQHGSTGIDLNRNYRGATNGTPEGDWGSTGDGSVTHWPVYETYCGPGAASELETLHFIDFVSAHRPTVLLSYHTYSELVIWPWGYDGVPKTPDNAVMVSLGQAMAARISGQSGGTYTPKQAAGLYPTTGDTTDWAYGELFYTQGKNCLPYTIELCTSFQPSYSTMTQVCNENWDALEYVLQQADSLRSQMTPTVLPPFLAAPETDEDGSYTVNWTENNPDANAQYYELQELTDLTISTDDLESGTGNWDLDGFASNTSKSHSATHSLRGKNSNATASAATTKHPLPVSLGDTLSFWTWYSLEVDYDYAFPEVSPDKRRWYQLDHFNGSSGGWKQKQYSLDDFAGESLFIRFRYATDAGTLGTGFWVDDISMVPSFGTVTTLGSQINAEYFDVSGKADGTYYYRVRGYGNTHGWGDFTVLDATTVELQIGPKVLSCAPTEGLMSGGAAVTVTGEDFTTTPDTTVFFDGEAATGVSVLNATTLTCNTPTLGHPGLVEIAVTNGNGTGALADGFEYTPDAGPPKNLTDIDTLNLPTVPIAVTFYTTGDPGAMYMLFASLGAGPTATPYGVMGLDNPIYWLATSFVGPKGYQGVTLNLPDAGPLDFYLHALVDDAPPIFAVGGNNPNGSGSVKFVLP